MKASTPLAAMLLFAGLAGGCLIDDSGGTRGQSSAPTATVPDSGSPVNRENAAKTLENAGETKDKADATLEVEPKSESK